MWERFKEILTESAKRVCRASTISARPRTKQTARWTKNIEIEVKKEKRCWKK